MFRVRKLVSDMPEPGIHHTAIVEDGAVIGANATVGAFAIIETGTFVDRHCEIAAHAIIKRGTRLGTDVRVDHHAVVGGTPQDLGFDESVASGVEIGDGARIREFVTIHRATRAGANTIIGRGCFLMANAHIAHDCVLGEGVIVANCALVAGHVHIADRAFISGGVVVHQFVRIGEGVMTSGNARLGMDVPPFVNALERNQVAGLNLIGLRRRGFSRDEIADLKACYAAVYHAGGANLVANATAALATGVAKTARGRGFLEFFTDAASRRKQFVRERET